MSKYNVVILSNPQSNEEDSLGRVFNALVLAADLKERNQSVQIFFQGAGTRWIQKLEDKSHPAHPLYALLKNEIIGASKACSCVFGAQEEIVKAGVHLVEEFNIPGLGGATSLAKRWIEGDKIITF